MGGKTKQQSKENLFQVARILAPTMKKRFADRKKAIEKKCEEDLVKRQEETARVQHKKLLQKQKLTQEIKSIDLWTNQTEVNSALGNLHTKMQRQRHSSYNLIFGKKFLAKFIPTNPY